jgi:hypothetical protein
MASYASLAELKAILRITDTDDDALLQLALDAATYGIDLAIGGVASGAAQLLVTVTAASDVISRTAHGLTDTTAVQFSSLAGGAGLVVGTQYYVRDSAADTFKLAAQVGGAVVDFTTNITEGWLGARQALYPIPPVAKLACEIQATRFFKRKDAAFGVLGSPEFWTYSRLQSKLDPDVELLLDGVGDRQRWGTTV